jgi:hypothetical protein
MEPTDRKLLDPVRACPELAEGTPSASRAVAGYGKYYFIRTKRLRFARLPPRVMRCPSGDSSIGTREAAAKQ